MQRFAAYRQTSRTNLVFRRDHHENSRHHNDGGGFADYVEIAAGTTVQETFRQRVKNGKPPDYLIRVNRLPVPADQVLQEGNRISFTPTKIEGGRMIAAS